MAKDRQRSAASAANPGAVYFFGMIGSLVYYIQQANGFWQVVVAFLKAIVWPALLTYDVLKFVH